MKSAGGESGGVTMVVVSECGCGVALVEKMIKGVRQRWVGWVWSEG